MQILFDKNGSKDSRLTGLGSPKTFLWPRVVWVFPMPFLFNAPNYPENK